MDNVKNDLYYVDKIKSDLQFIIKHTQDLTYDDFCTDEVLLDSVMFRLIQISEKIIGAVEIKLSVKSPKRLTKTVKNMPERIEFE